MSEKDNYIKLILQNKYRTPVGVRENDETIYANIAHEPLMLDQVRQIKVLQIHDTGSRIVEPDPIPPKYAYLYIIDKKEKFFYNSNGLLKYNENYYTQEELFYKFGITQTPSYVYCSKQGVTKCWYNEYLKLYWDVESKKWLTTPPDYE